jgi:hypothetical protein
MTDKNLWFLESLLFSLVPLSTSRWFYDILVKWQNYQLQKGMMIHQYLVDAKPFYETSTTEFYLITYFLV